MCCKRLTDSKGFMNPIFHPSVDDFDKNVAIAVEYVDTIDRSMKNTELENAYVGFFAHAPGKGKQLRHRLIQWKHNIEQLRYVDTNINAGELQTKMEKIGNILMAMYDVFKWWVDNCPENSQYVVTVFQVVMEDMKMSIDEIHSWGHFSQWKKSTPSKKKVNHKKKAANRANPAGDKKPRKPKKPKTSATPAAATPAADAPAADALPVVPEGVEAAADARAFGEDITNVVMEKLQALGV
jgi:hypothetical protein